jgi:hypothetical protein
MSGREARGDEDETRKVSDKERVKRKSALLYRGAGL